MRCVCGGGGGGGGGKRERREKGRGLCLCDANTLLIGIAQIHVNLVKQYRVFFAKIYCIKPFYCNHRSFLP